MKLSILMAAYNEAHWIENAVAKVLGQRVPGINELELIVVDDGSQDGTRKAVAELSTKHPGKIVPIYHEKNLGKGASLRDAVQKMTGDVCIIQDADLEYDPAEYGLMLEPIITGRADCVYGSRFAGAQSKRVLFFWPSVSSRILYDAGRVLPR